MIEQKSLWTPDGLGNVIPVGSLNFKANGAVFESSIVSKVFADSPYTVGAAVRYVNCDCTGGAITVNLPAATGSGRVITVKKTDTSTNIPTITRAASDTINGATTKTVFNQYGAVTIHDAAAGVWFITANPIPYDGGSIILNKAAGMGIKVDPTAPTYGWKDLIGSLAVDESGAGAATLVAYRGGSVREYRFGVNDLVDLRFHIPHDYVPGTDLYVHCHWSHNGTAITGTGTFTATYTHSYAKGYDQEAFSSEKTVTISDANVTTANTPQYRHKIPEAKLSDVGGTGNLLDTSLLEVDGLILIQFKVTVIPTITGGTETEPFVHFIDIHYQSTQTATKQRNGPNFYT